jgi:hypothetical protein
MKTKTTMIAPLPIDVLNSYDYHRMALPLLEYLVPKALMWQQSPARPPEIKAASMDEVMKAYTDLLAKLKEIHGNS